jgi:hypothetical protein
MKEIKQSVPSRTRETMKNFDGRFEVVVVVVVACVPAVVVVLVVLLPTREEFDDVVETVVTFPPMAFKV